jgi:hypothetical protein
LSLELPDNRFCSFVIKLSTFQRWIWLNHKIQVAFENSYQIGSEILSVWASDAINLQPVAPLKFLHGGSRWLIPQAVSWSDVIAKTAQKGAKFSGAIILTASGLDSFVTY